VQQPRKTLDFKKIDFEVFSRDIRPIYKIEFHKVGEIIFSTLTGKAIASH